MSLPLPSSSCHQVKEIPQPALLQEAHTLFTGQLVLRQIPKGHSELKEPHSCWFQAAMGSGKWDHRQALVDSVVHQSRLGISSEQPGNLTWLICVVF